MKRNGLALGEDRRGNEPVSRRVVAEERS